MVLRYKYIYKIKDLIKHEKNYINYFQLFFSRNFFLINCGNFFYSKKININLYRFFFWFFFKQNLKLNFYFFIKLFIFLLNYLFLLFYFKINKINYFLHINFNSFLNLQLNKKIYKKFITYLFNNIKIEFFFFFNSSIINYYNLVNNKYLNYTCKNIDPNLIFFLLYINYLV